MKTKLLGTNWSVLHRAGIIHSTNTLPSPCYIFVLHGNGIEWQPFLYVYAYIKSTQVFHRFSPFTLPPVGEPPTPFVKLFPPKSRGLTRRGVGGSWGERCSAPTAVTAEGLARMRTASSPAPEAQVARRAVVEPNGQCRIHRRPCGSGRAAPTRAVWRAGRAGTLTISASTRPPSPASSWRRSWAAPSSAPPVARPARGRPPPPPPLGRPGAPSTADPSARPPCWCAEGGSSAGGVGKGSGGPGASLARQPGPFQVVGGGAGPPRLRPAARTVPASEAGSQRRLLSARARRGHAPSRLALPLPGVSVAWATAALSF